MDLDQQDDLSRATKCMRQANSNKTKSPPLRRASV